MWAFWQSWLTQPCLKQNIFQKATRCSGSLCLWFSHTPTTYHQPTLSLSSGARVYIKPNVLVYASSVPNHVNMRNLNLNILQTREKHFTSSSPSILYIIAAGVFIDGSPRGRPTTARKCCSYCDVKQASIVWWPLLWGLGATSFSKIWTKKNRNH